MNRVSRTAPTWAIVVIVATVLVATIAGAYLYVKPERVAESGVIVGATVAPVTAAGDPMPRLKVVILHGGRTSCRTTGGCDDANYAPIVGAKEGWTLTDISNGGTGYVAGSTLATPKNYAAQLPLVYVAKPDVVIVEGSYSDETHPAAEVQTSATALFTALRTNLPKATIVAVGPAYGGSNPPAAVTATESAVKNAAQGRTTLFIDPIAEGWFAGANAALMSGSDQTLTDAGHAMFANQLIKDLAPLHLRVGLGTQ